MDTYDPDAPVRNAVPMFAGRRLMGLDPDPGPQDLLDPLDSPDRADPADRPDGPRPATSGPFGLTGRLGGLLHREGTTQDTTTPTPTSATAEPRWSRKRAGGDPHVVGQAFAGLLVLGARIGDRLVARAKGKALRAPSREQADDIAEPLARIACRHLPMDALSPDLTDAGLAAAAIDAYVHDGDLITERKPAPLTPDEPE